MKHQMPTFYVDYANSKDFLEYKGGLPHGVTIKLFVLKGEDVVEKFKSSRSVEVIKTLTDEDNSVLCSLMMHLANHSGHEKIYLVVKDENDISGEVLAIAKEKHDEVIVIEAEDSNICDILEEACGYCKKFNSSCGHHYNAKKFTCGHCETTVPCECREHEKEIREQFHSGKWYYKACKEVHCPKRFCKSPEGQNTRPKCTEAEHEQKKRKARGHFENVVNNECPDLLIGAKFMKVVNGVLRDHKMTAEYAGSRNKHTEVDNYSDVDIWVKSTSAVSKKRRNIITDHIRSALDATKTFQDIMVQNKPVATTFTGFLAPFRLFRFEFDLVFEKATWTEQRSAPPNNEAFHDKPHRQRCVRALKLLTRKVRTFAIYIYIGLSVMI